MEQYRNPKSQQLTMSFNKSKCRVNGLNRFLDRSLKMTFIIRRTLMEILQKTVLIDELIFFILFQWNM